MSKNENGELYILLLWALSVFLYIVVHEAIHGFFMKRYSGLKPKFGFTAMMAYAGSDAYFNIKHYIIISLSPMVISGIIFLILNIVVPKEWFWFVYGLQIGNISGATGDLYVFYIISKMPNDILIKDSGVSMEIYLKYEALVNY